MVIVLRSSRFHYHDLRFFIDPEGIKTFQGDVLLPMKVVLGPSQQAPLGSEAAAVYPMPVSPVPGQQDSGRTPSPVCTEFRSFCTALYHPGCIYQESFSRELGGGGGSARLAPALVWAGAWLRPTHPTIDHRAVVGGVKTGTGVRSWSTCGFRRSGGCGGQGVAPLNVRAP